MVTERVKQGLVKKLVASHLEAANISDRVCISKGRVEVRRTFFYTNGYTAEKYAEKIQNALGGGFNVVGEEHWHSWPKESYWAAVVTAK